jgi:hypothetical protein
VSMTINPSPAIVIHLRQFPLPYSRCLEGQGGWGGGGGGVRVTPVHKTKLML